MLEGKKVGNASVSEGVDKLNFEDPTSIGIGLNDQSKKESFKETFVNPKANLLPEGYVPSLSVNDFSGSGGTIRPTDPNIFRGSYSGSMIGSVPIFGANVFSEVGNTTQREHALKQAAHEEAKLKQKEAKDRRDRLYKFDPYSDLSKIDDVKFNENLQKQTTNEIDLILGQSKLAYGDDWIDILSTPSSEEAKKIENIRQNHEVMSTIGNEVLTDLSELRSAGGDKLFSPATKEIANNLFYRTGRFQDSNPEELIELKGKLEGSMTVDKYINSNLATQLKPVINKHIEEASRQGKVGLKNITIKTLPKDVYQRGYDNIKGAMQLSELYGFSPEEEDKLIRQSLDNYLRTEISSSFQNLSGTGEDQEQKNVVNIKRDQPFTFKPQGGTDNATANAAQTLSHEPTKVVGTSSSEVIDSATGERLDVAGSFDAVLGETSIVPVLNRDFTVGDAEFKKGSIIPQKWENLVKKKGALEYAVYSFGTAKILNEDYTPGVDKVSDQYIKKQIYAPTDRYAASLNDNDVPVNKFLDEASRMNNELHIDNIPEESKGISEQEFNQKWSTLKSGESLVGPDGNTYTKK